MPSETCTLSVVDIIFTRLGAADRIMTGESKFFISKQYTFSPVQIPESFYVLV